MEAALIHVWPALYNRYTACPQTVVLEVFFPYSSGGSHQKFSFEAGPVPPPIEEIIPSDVDILEHTLAGSVVTDVSWAHCRYYSCDVDRAEAFMTSRYPRPWTLAKVLGWYREATDPATKAHLAHVLGASRDPRAALALGEMIESTATMDMWDARFAAGEALEERFVPTPECGEWPQAGLQRRTWGSGLHWFQQNKARLAKMCAALPSTEAGK
jgi:hypothetical protein